MEHGSLARYVSFCQYGLSGGYPWKMRPHYKWTAARRPLYSVDVDAFVKNIR